MLEVILSDFARLEAETTEAEDMAQKEYDSFMTDSAMDKATKTSDLDHKTQKKQDQEEALASSNSDLEGTQEELNAALAYFEKLKPKCIGEPVDYEKKCFALGRPSGAPTIQFNVIGIQIYAWCWTNK